MGWWTATPKKSKRSRWQSAGGASLPPVQMQSLCGWLSDLGYAESGMDLSALSFREIGAWASACAIPLTPWIAETLRKGSEAFIKGHREGQKQASNPPWTLAETDREAAQAMASSRIAESLRTIREVGTTA